MNVRADRPVVVVDDDPDDLALSSMMLRKVAGVSRLMPFNTPESAIEFLRKVGVDADDFPSMLVLDVKMPGMTGLDLLEWVRRQPRFERVPVVMWSSSDDPGDVERAGKLGAQCYLGKYPPVPAVAEMFVAAKNFEMGESGDGFSDVAGNLLTQRTAGRSS